MDAIAQKLEKIVGSTGVVLWENIVREVDNPSLQAAQISQAVVPGTPITGIVYPNSQEELAEVITCAHSHRWCILPCGSGSKLSWGGLVMGREQNSPSPLIVISTERLNRLIEHAVGDLTITIEAGMKFAQLQEIVASAGQFLSLDPSYPENATIGGIVATADAGSLRQRYGGVRDLLLGLSFVRADGQIAKAGGRVVKNVAGYDLMKLFTGSYGTLGIISEVTLRVYPLQEASQTVVLTGESRAIAQATKTLLGSALTPTAADLLSPQLTASLGFGQGISLVTRFQSVTESVQEQSARLLEVGQHLGLQGTTYQETDEVQLWKTLPEKIWLPKTESAITCKIGVIPSEAVGILTQLDTLAPQILALLHGGRGLGLLRFDSLEVKPQTLIEMRSCLVTHGGFLTILEAPVTFKQQLDVWGYTGNALDLMRRIKKQFDPDNLLNPHRFVSGI